MCGSLKRPATGLAVAALMATAPLAQAVPVLQLYVEGSAYDSGSESWVVTSGGPVRLWAIGDTSWKGAIADVRLAIAYPDGLTPLFTLTPGTTGGLGGFTDPSTPAAPSLLRTVTDGSAPKLGDGSDLPAHGVYGLGTAWQEYGLGDFTLTDSPIADFIDSFPAPGPQRGQINVYDISFTGLNDGDWIHFDLYDHVQGNPHAYYKFAPFSHDATFRVPEPRTLLLLGVGLLGLGVFRIRLRPLGARRAEATRLGAEGALRQPPTLAAERRPR